MNNIDRSLEKINIIKLLIFLSIFIITTLVLILTLILPNVKQYRSYKNQYNSAVVHKTKVQNVLNGRINEIKKLRLDNAKVFNSFKHKFTKPEFVLFANNFFDKVTLKEVKKSIHKKEFKVYELNVTSALKTPVNFYKFLDGLNHYQNMIQADFPIDLKSNGKVINATFKIKVFGLVSLEK
ncbi:MAG: hypothetical protein GXP61_09915 [Epsilonproteobacteria bacterium]|nr:hypothetical protein [Campylobacterota bacterium]